METFDYKFGDLILFLLQSYVLAWLWNGTYLFGIKSLFYTLNIFNNE